MRHILLSLSFILALGTGLQAQNFSLSPNPEVTVEGLASDNLLKALSTVTNTTNAPLTLRWVKYDENIPTGWDASVCDINTCYFPNITTADFTLPAGGSATMSVWFGVQGIDGMGDVKVAVFEPTDSMGTVQANHYFCSAFPTSTEDLSVAELSIYPNPATTFITIPNHTSLGMVKIIDIVGRNIATINLDGAEEVDYDVSSLSKGTYMVQFVDDKSKTVHTGRFVKK